MKVRDAMRGFLMRMLQSPEERELQRTRLEVMKRDVYAASEVNRLLADWVTSRMAPDDEMRWSVERIRSRARDLEKNNPMVRQYLRMLGVNVIGPRGIRLSAKVRDASGRLNERLNERIEDGWEEWAQAPTLDGKMDLAAFMRLLLKTTARDGEVLVRKWRGFEGNRFRFALEAVDADQLDVNFTRLRSVADGTNEIRMGVEVDSNGRPVAYHVWDKPLRLAGAASRNRIRVPADEIVHLYDPDRVNQTRGVSWLVSVMVSAKMLGGYIEAELVAARISAAKMGFFQRKANEGTGALPDGNAADLNVEANPGTFTVLPDGYEVGTWSPDHPSTAFGDFVKAAQREFATGLGISYNALASDLEGVNYSSMRSGLLVERDLWLMLQQWWIGAFLRPVYAEWLNMALLSSAVVLDARDFRKFLAVKWTPRGWPWVDPLKDTQAGVLGVQNALTSRQQLLDEQGRDIEDVFEELAEEKTLAKQFDIDIEPKPLEKAPKPGTTGGGDAGGEEGDGDAEGSAEGEGKSTAGIVAALRARAGAYLNGRTNGHA